MGGLSELENGFVGQYAIEGEEAQDPLTLHLIVAEDGCAAESILGRAGESLAKRATGALVEIAIGEARGVQAEVKYRGPVLMLRYRSYIILATGTVDHPQAREVVGRLLANLTS